MPISDQIVKKAHSASTFTTEQIRELAKCFNDPIYFMQNFVYIQHPTQGRQLLQLYPYQQDMVKIIHNNRFSILLTARQLGKCLTSINIIKIKSPSGDIINISIGDFYEWQQFRKWAKEVPELQEFIQK